MWKIEDVPNLRGFTVEWMGEGRFLLSKKNRLYETSDINDKPKLIGEVPALSINSFLANFRLGQRLTRFMFFNVLPLANGEVFVTFGKQAGVFRDGNYQALSGLERPFRVMRGACAVDQYGDIYFGEYLVNHGQSAIRIYRYTPENKKTETVYTFAPAEILHVHGIYFDPYTNALWCVTGDSATESKIIRTYDGFKTLEIIGTGNESWRTMSLQFTKDAIYYASDAEFNDNFIYRLDRQTGERKTICQIDGPVYYSCSIGEDLFFAVTAEIAPSQKKQRAVIWHVSPQTDTAKEIYSAEKDLLQNKKLGTLFMFGILHFARGQSNKEEMFIHGVGLKKIDNRTLRISKLDLCNNSLATENTE